MNIESQTQSHKNGFLKQMKDGNGNSTWAQHKGLNWLLLMTILRVIMAVSFTIKCTLWIRFFNICRTAKRLNDNNHIHFMSIDHVHWKVNETLRDKYVCVCIKKKKKCDRITSASSESCVLFGTLVAFPNSSKGMNNKMNGFSLHFKIWWINKYKIQLKLLMVWECVMIDRAKKNVQIVIQEGNRSNWIIECH